MDKLNEQFYNDIKKIELEYDELQRLMASNEVLLDNKLFMHYLKRSKEIEEIALKSKKLSQLETKIETECFSSLPDETDFANKIKSISEEIENVINQLKILLSKSASNQEQNVSFEITFNGVWEEFSDLGILVEKICESYSFDFKKQTKKEKCIYKISGKGAYDKLKNFVGQVKFVKNGNTFFAIVCVIKECETVPEFSGADVEVQTLKSGGAGGQHINKTESAVRLIHRPTGISVKCQDERSQVQNKAVAMEKLKAKVLSEFKKNCKKEAEFQRKSMQNAFFADTPSTCIDYDKNIFSLKSLNISEKLNKVLNGEIKIII